MSSKRKVVYLVNEGEIVFSGLPKGTVKQVVVDFFLLGGHIKGHAEVVLAPILFKCLSRSSYYLSMPQIISQTCL